MTSGFRNYKPLRSIQQLRSCQLLLLLQQLLILFTSRHCRPSSFTRFWTCSVRDLIHWCELKTHIFSGKFSGFSKFSSEGLFGSDDVFLMQSPEPSHLLVEPLKEGGRLHNPALFFRFFCNQVTASWDTYLAHSIFVRCGWCESSSQYLQILPPLPRGNNNVPGQNVLNFFYWYKHLFGHFVFFKRAGISKTCSTYLKMCLHYK